MLRDKAIWESHERIVLVHGCRYLSDLAYLDELKLHQKLHPGKLEFVPVVSRQKADHGFRGRITEGISSGMLEQIADVDLGPDSSAVMLCGNPQMLDDVEAILQSRGMHKHKKSEPGHYVVERYW
jgi:ferredoxin--NADP+ reductase